MRVETWDLGEHLSEAYLGQFSVLFAKWKQPMLFLDLLNYSPEPISPKSLWSPLEPGLESVTEQTLGAPSVPPRSCSGPAALFLQPFLILRHLRKWTALPLSPIYFLWTSLEGNIHACMLLLVQLVLYACYQLLLYELLSYARYCAGHQRHSSNNGNSRCSSK